MNKSLLVVIVATSLAVMALITWAVLARMKVIDKRFHAAADSLKTASERFRANNTRTKANIERLIAEAERDTVTLPQQAEQVESFPAFIGESLFNDGLVRDTRNYHLKINDAELYVDGTQQSRQAHQHYKKLIEKGMGLRICGEWMTFDIQQGRHKITLP
jgi:hypothetical protein